MLAFCQHSCFVALLAITSLSGCAAAPSPTPVAMMSATCAPGQRQTMMPTATMPADTESVPSDETVAHHDFAPLFAATCRPDHQFTAFNMITHADLALAFIDARPAPVYDFIPMFGSTASPAARPITSNVAAPADLADAAP